MLCAALFLEPVVTSVLEMGCWYTPSWCTSICVFSHLVPSVRPCTLMCRSAALGQWPQQHGDHKYPQNGKYSVVGKVSVFGISHSVELSKVWVTRLGLWLPFKQVRLRRAGHGSDGVQKPARNKKSGWNKMPFPAALCHQGRRILLYRLCWKNFWQTAVISVKELFAYHHRHWCLRSWADDN